MTVVSKLPIKAPADTSPWNAGSKSPLSVASGISLKVPPNPLFSNATTFANTTAPCCHVFAISPRGPEIMQFKSGIIRITRREIDISFTFKMLSGRIGYWLLRIGDTCRQQAREMGKQLNSIRVAHYFSPFHPVFSNRNTCDSLSAQGLTNSHPPNKLSSKKRPRYWKPAVSDSCRIQASVSG